MTTEKDQPTKSDAEVAIKNDKLNIMAWEQSRLSMASGEISIKDDDAFRVGYIKGYNAKQSDAVEFYNFTQGMPVDVETGKIYFNKSWYTIEQLYEQFKNR